MEPVRSQSIVTMATNATNISRAEGAVKDVDSMGYIQGSPDDDEDGSLSVDNMIVKI